MIPCFSMFSSFFPSSLTILIFFPTGEGFATTHSMSRFNVPSQRLFAQVCLTVDAAGTVEEVTSFHGFQHLLKLQRITTCLIFLPQNKMDQNGLLFLISSFCLVLLSSRNAPVLSSSVPFLSLFLPSLSCFSSNLTTPAVFSFPSNQQFPADSQAPWSQSHLKGRQ